MRNRSLSKIHHFHKAIQRLNARKERDQWRRRLLQASLKVRENSIKINAEFSDIDDIE